MTQLYQHTALSAVKIVGRGAAKNLSMNKQRKQGETGERGAHSHAYPP